MSEAEINPVTVVRKRASRIWPEEISCVLISATHLKKRVRELARQIERDYIGRDLVIVALLKGTVLFLADLIRQLKLPLHLDFIGISSYREGVESKDLIVTKELRIEVKGRDVLIVDDILDTGRTMERVAEKIQRLKPHSLKTCVLLDKPSRRVTSVRADYTGFILPDAFVIGYGLDYAERYRNLPFIGVLRPHVYQKTR